MKEDRRFGESDGAGPEDLRTILREWTVPGPPLEIEQQLRRTFRRRRAKLRRILWLAVAASLTLLLAYRVASPRRPAPAVVAERPTSVAPPAPSPPGEPTRVEGGARVHNAPVRVRRALPLQPAEAEVVVEPRQRELLAQLALRLQGAHQALPCGSGPRIEVIPADAPPSPIWRAQAADHVLPHRTRWEKVGSEWPFLQRSL